MCINKLICTSLIVSIFAGFDAQSQSNTFFSRSRSFQSMTERWELDSTSRRSTFLISTYKPVYFTAGRKSSNPNQQPTSENPLYTLPFVVPYNKYECKFQLSFKSKLIQGLIKGNGDLWVGYTQKAHWQIYNAELSRPFRELNYEPEIILNFATNFSLLGFNTRMLSVIFNHQSNGRIIPLSRSWNRVILQAAFERKNWQLYLRPWIRLPDEEDENPAITDYIGRGETVLIHNAGKHQLSMVATHSLRLGDKNRGSIQGNWVFPIWGNFKGQLQVSEGYGETLIDYNHRQATIGLSVSLMEW